VNEDALAAAVQARGATATILTLRVTPNAKKAAVSLRDDGVLLVRVAAPAVEGAANAELLRWLTRDLLGLPRGAATLTHGASSRDKRVEVEAPVGDVTRRLRELLIP
jgi:uncharacterized protein YggU (UPF0235/DUF167 family)